MANENCSICLEMYTNYKLSCGHEFHKECIDKWFSRLNPTCPLCRAVMPIYKSLYSSNDLPRHGPTYFNNIFLQEIATIRILDTPTFTEETDILSDARSLLNSVWNSESSTQQYFQLTPYVANTAVLPIDFSSTYIYNYSIRPEEYQPGYVSVISVNYDNARRNQGLQGLHYSN